MIDILFSDHNVTFPCAELALYLGVIALLNFKSTTPVLKLPAPPPPPSPPPNPGQAQVNESDETYLSIIAAGTGTPTATTPDHQEKTRWVGLDC